ncbi:hypothetical protein HYX12_05005 [Candidatus Woesearchaeota archaeon]|nr:hypothetical protein [Candidatus Woesearchaeota archaeon]
MRSFTRKYIGEQEIKGVKIKDFKSLGMTVKMSYSKPERHPSVGGLPPIATGRTLRKKYKRTFITESDEAGKALDKMFEDPYYQLPVQMGLAGEFAVKHTLLGKLKFIWAGDRKIGNIVMHSCTITFFKQ